MVAGLFFDMGHEALKGSRVEELKRGSEPASAERSGSDPSDSVSVLQCSTRSTKVTIMDSLAPARSALTGLWLRPHSFRRFPSGSSPLISIQNSVITGRLGRKLPIANG